jgi:hypothetical protein
MISELPLKQSIPDTHLPLLQHAELMFSGGYPLWLAGGAAFYSDIDVYPRSWRGYYAALNFLEKYGRFCGRSPRSIAYQYAGDTWQLIQPAQVSLLDLMLTADLSPCATVLVWDDHQFRLYTLYPEDIANRVCRVLTHHDWSQYRIEVYQKKGYTVS